MVIKSFVGGHSLNIYSGCEYDSSVRKFRGGEKIAEIPYSGRMLSAQLRQESAAPVEFEGVAIPTKTPPTFEGIDPLPPREECDFCIVSAMYAAACRALGMKTERLLTIGDIVVDDDNRTIGACSLNRN